MDLSVEHLTIILVAIVLAFIITYVLLSKFIKRKRNTFLLNSLVHEQDQYIIFFDFDSKVIFANNKFLKLIGEKKSKVFGKSFIDLPIDEFVKKSISQI